MTEDELLERIEGREGLHTDFKRDPGHAARLAEDLAAFANTDGGDLFIGVDDDGSIVGVPDPDAVARLVDSAAYNNCDPPVTVVTEVVETRNGPVVRVRVPKSSVRPHAANERYYVRTASGKRPASREELLRLFQASRRLYYDETPLFGCGLEYLEEEAWAELQHATLRYGMGLEDAGVPPHRLLVNWHLAADTPEGLVLTLAGALFLARRPQDFLPYAYVSALRVPGSDLSAEPSDQKRLSGRLPQVLDDALRFLEIHLARPHRIAGMEPEARPELPSAALREALVNAAAHRDYSVSAPIRLIVLDDRVEVRSPGDLPNTVTFEAMRFGFAHVLRNPTIYNCLLRLGMVTDAGSGVPRMIRLVREAVEREPEFAIEGAETVVRLPRP